MVCSVIQPIISRFLFLDLDENTHTTPIADAEELVPRVSVAAAEIRDMLGVFLNVWISMRWRYEVFTQRNELIKTTKLVLLNIFLMFSAKFLVEVRKRFFCV